MSGSGGPEAEALMVDASSTIHVDMSRSREQHAFAKTKHQADIAGNIGITKSTKDTDKDQIVYLTNAPDPDNVIT